MASPSIMENGNIKGLSKETRHGRTAHNMSSSSLRKKSDLTLVSKVPCACLRKLLANLQEVLLGTKLSILFPAIPLAVIATYCGFGTEAIPSYRHEQPVATHAYSMWSWVFAMSLLGLTPLAERMTFLTEQIAYYTGPTVGGLLNATFGNTTELIIAILALIEQKVDVVKYSLLGSILSNLLLVLGTSLFCGGIVNLTKEQNFERKQSDVNSLLLLMALLCQSLPLMFQYVGESSTATDEATLLFSRVGSIVMLIAYLAYLVFQLWTHRQLFDAQEEDDVHNDEVSEEAPVIGFWSGFVWLALLTALTALLSEYVVNTIEVVSESWGIPVGFISIIMLPIAGNATEHAGAIVFAFKNKLDISLGVALGSATQIAMFVVPLIVIVAWIIGIKMDLNFNLLETCSLAMSILITAFTLQDGTSHYLKGMVLMLCYITISACFFIFRAQTTDQVVNLGINSSTEGMLRI